MKNVYPIKNGWIHANLKLKNGAINKQDAVSFLKINEIDYEIVYFQSLKTVARLIFRKKPTTIKKTLEANCESLELIK